MIGYLGYCKRVEPKAECEGTESPETVYTEEYLPETSPHLFWSDLKAMLSEKLNNVEFANTIK